MINLQKILRDVPKDKELFKTLVFKFNRNTKDAELAYCVFVGAYYHDKTYGEKAINVIQKYSNAHQFNIFNSMMIQAHFYLRKAPGTRHQLNLHLNRVGDYVDDRWRALNPFIVPASTSDPKLVYIGIRMTNFDKNGTNYFAAHGGSIKNFYEGQRYDLARHRMIYHYKYRDLTDYPRFTNEWYHVEGLEDFRVACSSSFPSKIKGVEEELTPCFAKSLRYVGFVVSVDAHSEGFPHKQLPRQSLVDIEFDNENFYLNVKNLRPCRGTHVNNFEAQKNWLPFFDKQGQLFIIYKTSPFMIMKVNEEDGTCENIMMRAIDGTINFRGSSPPIPYGDNFLYAVHIVGFLPEGKGRVYYHRLVEFSLKAEPNYSLELPTNEGKEGKEYEIKRISRMFYLNEKSTVEYISGGYNDGELIHFTYGFDDREAWIASFTFDEIESMFP